MLVLSIAFYNGANDVSKGVATLHGSGLCSYRSALRWGTVWTMAGGITAFFVASGLLKLFSKGILSNGLDLTENFSVAVAAGVIGWLWFATRTGMPVSTTHSIVGSICGVGVLAFGTSNILWGALVSKIIIPLLLSPLIALMIIFFVYRTGYGLLSRLSKYCVCFELKENVCCEASPGLLSSTDGTLDPAVEVNTIEKCVENNVSPVKSSFNDIAHWISSALISFARGLNDTPKIVAVLFVSMAAFKALELKTVFILGTLSMGLGSYFRGMRVTETLSEKITGMDKFDSVIANLSTAFLVAFASRFGVPVSTTHVSSGSIIGIGLKRDSGRINKRIIFDMLLAWLVTLPVTGIISGIIYVILRHLI